MGEIHSRFGEFNEIWSFIRTSLIQIIELHILPAQVVDIKDDDIRLRRGYGRCHEWAEQPEKEESNDLGA